MVVKLYISGISGNKEVKKKQQRVQMILDSKQITYEAIDITEPGKEKDKEFMQQYGKVRESLGKYPLPPQIFNDDNFCGDYEDFDLANEVDELEKFLHIETKDLENGSKVNGMREEVIDARKVDNGEINRDDIHEVNGLDDGESAAEHPPGDVLQKFTEGLSVENEPFPKNELDNELIKDEEMDDAEIEKTEENERIQEIDQVEEENAVEKDEMYQNDADKEKEQDE